MYISIHTIIHNSNHPPLHHHTHLIATRIPCNVTLRDASCYSVHCNPVPSATALLRPVGAQATLAITSSYHSGRVVSVVSVDSMSVAVSACTTCTSYTEQLEALVPLVSPPPLTLLLPPTIVDVIASLLLLTPLPLLLYHY